MRLTSIFVAALAILCVPVSSRAQDNFTDVPDTHWAYKDLARLRAMGFVPQPTSLQWGPRYSGREELAKGVVAAVATLSSVLRKNPVELDKQFLATDMRVMFPALLKEFEPEIKKMGRDVKALRKSYEECERLAIQIAKPFRDVPPGHWAAKDIQELKEAGILSGYPDGKFRG